MEIGTLIAIGLTQAIAFIVWVIRMNNKVTILETKSESQEKQFSDYKNEKQNEMRDIKMMFTQLQASIESNFKEIRTELHEIDKRKS